MELYTSLGFTDVWLSLVPHFFGGRGSQEIMQGMTLLRGCFFFRAIHFVSFSAGPLVMCQLPYKWKSQVCEEESEHIEYACHLDEANISVHSHTCCIKCRWCFRGENQTLFLWVLVKFPWWVIRKYLNLGTICWCSHYGIESFKIDSNLHRVHSHIGYTSSIYDTNHLHIISNTYIWYQSPIFKS